MSQKRYAFLMGANGPQTSVMKPLQYAECDAKRLSEALRDTPCAFTNATWVTAINAHTTLSELELFTKQCVPSDLLVLHFAGHAYYTRGHLYLLCNDTDVDGSSRQLLTSNSSKIFSNPVGLVTSFWYLIAVMQEPLFHMASEAARK